RSQGRLRRCLPDLFGIVEVAATPRSVLRLLTTGSKFAIGVTSPALSTLMRTSRHRKNRREVCSVLLPIMASGRSRSRDDQEDAAGQCEGTRAASFDSLGPTP